MREESDSQHSGMGLDSGAVLLARDCMERH